jgi:hypothetical protein
VATKGRDGRFAASGSLRRIASSRISSSKTNQSHRAPSGLIRRWRYASPRLKSETTSGPSTNGVARSGSIAVTERAKTIECVEEGPESRKSGFAGEQR